MKKLFGLILVSLLLTSCGDGFNVEYQICDIQYKNCQTFVKFKTLDSCERYKIYSESYCDSVTTPGKMICDTSKKYDERFTSVCREK